ncbi:T9SS type A sorting domain-containing protein [Dyadobacter psychrotolerans]|uniref:T9SS type A sorting domain-containing protein n=1 Tax=Dyadobacter psychrotolerans TaxID=2541721 RepID=A0A4R5D9W4_9BACT|nr:T9SS type A sorting domain-containing protein [Dyadobacter psychrotolerans]TDE08551.1 T9SS type A sorting domain-containing protein [Dyadobacter psychrotolerans]
MNKLFYIFKLILFLSLACDACFAQKGIVNTQRVAPYGFVNFGPAAEVSGMNNLRHIDGYVKKQGSSNFLFPVGDNGLYRPFVAAAEGISGAYFGVNPGVAVTSNNSGGNFPVLPAGGPFNISSKSSEVSVVSSKEYWDINGAAGTKITLTWSEFSDINSLVNGNLANLILLGWNGNQWVSIQSAIDAVSAFGSPSSLSSGSITTIGAFSPDTYNVYTLGAKVGGPLPVTLISFSAGKQEGSVLLDWSTSAEIDSESFEIQNSPDGKKWFVIGNQKSKDTGVGIDNSYSFLHTNPWEGENFYRLKIIDKDRTFTFSSIKSVIFNEAGIIVYPNPVYDRIYFKNLLSSEVEKVSLINPSGKTVYASSSFSIDGIDVKHLDTGFYVLSIITKRGDLKSFKILLRR